MVRHGESEWNKRNRFTGWVDIPLSMKGVDEALAAGKKISNEPIDVIFTSTLIRGQMTAMLAMLHHYSKKVPRIVHPEDTKLGEWGKVYNDDIDEVTIPVIAAWQLNERMYGELQGLDKQETRKKFGDEQVKVWRRSFRTAPPQGESLAMTAERTIPYFEEKVVGALKEGKNVFISAHGNSLRSIVMDLENLSEEEVLQLEIATGDPLTYTYEDGKWKKQ